MNVTNNQPTDDLTTCTVNEAHENSNKIRTAASTKLQRLSTDADKQFPQCQNS